MTANTPPPYRRHTKNLRSEEHEEFLHLAKHQHEEHEEAKDCFFCLEYFLVINNQRVHNVFVPLVTVTPPSSAWKLALLSIAVIPGIAFAGGLYAYTLTGLNSKSRESYANVGIISEELTEMHGCFCRKYNKSSMHKVLVEAKMGESVGTSGIGEAKTGQMVFEPILEEGVFRFDCSADARNTLFPSLSFVNSQKRDTPLMSIHKVPSYILTYEHVVGQQIVYFELPAGTSFYGTDEVDEVSGQLERTGKRYCIYIDWVLKNAINAGTVFIPPKWSLGYQQCRWSYDSDLRVREIAKTFRDKGIPCDVMWMDIDYMDGFRCFTFDQVCALALSESGF
ncbi:hypothetical protein CTI12_AA296190 [Artemisia annua]|uniref:Glycoside hydrolase family 31 TIM barrel domain-containing protein n=1 Tax=Artemisia annua TaxID=35608 RepID=A0A2U1N7T2_ARTAN|nr:hypothetical protein CTI12_AA296190 [Artemisia annua]